MMFICIIKDDTLAYSANLIFTHHPNKHKQIVLTFVQRRPNIFDAGLTLYECSTNILCLLGCLLFINTDAAPDFRVFIYTVYIYIFH